MRWRNPRRLIIAQVREGGGEEEGGKSPTRRMTCARELQSTHAARSPPSYAGLVVHTRRNYSSTSSSRASPLLTHFLFRDGVHLRPSAARGLWALREQVGRRKSVPSARRPRRRGGIITRAIFHIGTPNERMNACPPIRARAADRSA